MGGIEERAFKRIGDLADRPSGFGTRVFGGLVSRLASIERDRKSVV